MLPSSEAAGVTGALLFVAADMMILILTRCVICYKFYGSNIGAISPVVVVGAVDG